MSEIVLPPRVDHTKPLGYVVTSEGDVCECSSEEDVARLKEMEHGLQRMFLFIVTVLPAVLGLCAWGESLK